MIDLNLYSNPIQSIFELIGNKENDLSKSIAWAFANCQSLLLSFLNEAFLGEVEFEASDMEVTVINLEESEKEKGRTDFEIIVEGKAILIIEAKRGWILPEEIQLAKYSERTILQEKGIPHKRIVALTECGPAYSKTFFKIQSVNDIPVCHKSWKDIYRMAGNLIGQVGRKEKQLIQELQKYLSNVMPIQNKNSNWVYVVSISNGNPKGWDISWWDIVDKKRRYFHEVGNGWPKTPPNYIAFRFQGKLQSIHHIEGYELFHNPAEHFPEAPETHWPKHFLYKLGDPIIPAKEVRSGPIWNARMYCMIDTLLTCDTIKEARKVSSQRQDNPV